MPGPAPKHPSVRARANKTSTAATLKLVHDVKMPELPPRTWHAMTIVWWRDIWASPMAPEFDKSDKHGLFILAMLVDDFWENPTREAAAEIRLQRQAFGLTPLDRRRLQWQIEQAEEAQERGARRRTAAPNSVNKADDPRSVLGTAV